MTRVSRRRLLTSGAAASVLAASGLPTRARSSGGTLRLGLSGAGPADNWDARTHTDSFMIMAGHGCVFDCLTEISAAGELIGELAESWEASGDARVWTFTLRRDAYFHDGKRFGADDVIASLRLHVEDGTRSGARHIVEAIEHFEKLTEHQVRLTLRAPNADFPFLLSDFHLVMYPSDNISGAMESGIGTGLYKVDRFEPGRRLLASRVAGHYKDGHAGCFDSVELLAINDARARMDALLSRRVDAVNRVDFRVESQLRADRNTRIIETTGNQHLAFEMSGRPGRDGRTLQTALKHAIDREDIVRTLLRGHGSAAQDHPVGPANQYFDKSLGTCAFDPERARSLIADAGLAGTRLNLVVANSVFPGIEDVGHRFAESLGAAGLDLTVTRQSGAARPTGGGCDIDRRLFLRAAHRGLGVLGAGCAALRPGGVRCAACQCSVGIRVVPAAGLVPGDAADFRGHGPPDCSGSRRSCGCPFGGAHSFRPDREYLSLGWSEDDRALVVRLRRITAHCGKTGFIASPAHRAGRAGGGAAPEPVHSGQSGDLRIPVTGSISQSIAAR